MEKKELVLGTHRIICTTATVIFDTIIQVTANAIMNFQCHSQTWGRDARWLGAASPWCNYPQMWQSCIKPQTPSLWPEERHRAVLWRGDFAWSPPPPPKWFFDVKWTDDYPLKIWHITNMQLWRYKIQTYQHLPKVNSEYVVPELFAWIYYSLFTVHFHWDTQTICYSLFICLIQ
jgi:hypothetical protein